MTIHEANMRILFELYSLYGNDESAGIANLVMENVTGWSRIDRVVNKHVTLSVAQQQQFEGYIGELLKGRPVQYVLKEAWFASMKFFVDENVLIPRPETEELVDLAVKELRSLKNSELSVIDIGTGSGCIAIALKKLLPNANVFAIDISEKALSVAIQNAKANGTEISFKQVDFLDQGQIELLPHFDFIISNPPYIPLSQQISMHDNVTKFEPHLALFIPDNDPMKFYKSIAEFADKKIFQGGKVFVEIHENFAEDVVAEFVNFDVNILRDLQGKNRFVRAVKP